MLSRFLLCLGLLLQARLNAADRPNILWITTEDMSANLGCYGDTFARTPNLDAFARQAVRYTHAFAAAPVCSPSRATLITGVHANSLGNPHLRSQVKLPAGFTGYPAFLRSAGYFTTNNVKTDYNLQDEAELVRTWWNRSDAKAHWRQRAPGQRFMSVFNLMDTHQSRSSAWSEEMFEREIGRQLPSSERADPTKVPVPPFYPDNASSRKAMARYYDCIAVMDRKVGAILAELEADGLADDTIVFYYSDHGMGMPRGKRLLYDSGMHVPLLIRFPKKWEHLAPSPAGTAIDRLVTFVDFAPTLLSLAAAPIPSHYQGVAFLGAAAGPARAQVFGARDRVDEAFDTARSVREERWLYIRNYRPHLSWAPPESYSDTSDFRVELLKQARAGKLGTGPTAWLAPSRAREELYDTRADPHQLHNLASNPAHRATLMRLRGDLRDWLLRIHDISFLAEEDMSARSQTMSPYELARAEGAVALERIQQTAELVGDPAAVPAQKVALKDPDRGVRYWAAVGFAANPTATRLGRTELEAALRDDAPAVRIEVAGALAGALNHTQAVAVLGKEVQAADLNVALHAARTLELLGSPAKPLLEQLRERLAAARALAASSPMEFYISMALGSLVLQFDQSNSK